MATTGRLAEARSTTSWSWHAGSSGLSSAWTMRSQAAREEDPLAADSHVRRVWHMPAATASPKSMMRSGQNIEQNKIGQATESPATSGRGAARAVGYPLQPTRARARTGWSKSSARRRRNWQILPPEQRGLEKKLHPGQRTGRRGQRYRELQRLTRQQEQLQQEAELRSLAGRGCRPPKPVTASPRRAGKMEQGAKSGGDGDGATAAEQAAAAGTRFGRSPAGTCLTASRPKSTWPKSNWPAWRMPWKACTNGRGPWWARPTHYQQRQADAAATYHASESISVREMAARAVRPAR